jgi:hypothetical protein
VVGGEGFVVSDTIMLTGILSNQASVSVYHFKLRRMR